MARNKNTRKRNNKNYDSKSKPRSRKLSNIEDNDVDVTGRNLPSHNDPAWYKYDDTMFNGVIQMPTLEFKGKNIPWKATPPINVEVSMPQNYIRPPLVSAYYMNPAAGPGNAPQNSPEQYNNPINVAARSMYAQLSASNAKTSAYAPQDIATLILMLGQIIAMTQHYKRLYKICNYFNFYNRAIPEAMLNACHVIYSGTEDIRKNLSDYRSKLNQLIARINSIKFPSNLNYFKKCGYIYDNVFVDRDDEMPTFQLMIPYSTWVVDETLSGQGSVLKTQELSELASYDTHLGRLSNMIEQVLTSATFNYIYADILNLANRGVINDPLITIPMLGIDEVITPLYSEQFNWQVMNMTIIGRPNAPQLTMLATPNNDVYPNVETSGIVYAPRFKIGGTQSQLLNETAIRPPVRLPNINVSQDEFVELLAYYNASALMIYKNLSDESFIATACPSISDYYCVNQCVWYGDGNVSNTYQSPYVTNINDLEVLNIVHSPFYYTGSFSATSLTPLSKLGSFTQVDENALSNLRFETYLGLFKFE